MINKIKNLSWEAITIAFKILIALLIIFNIENYNLVVYLFLALALIS